MPWISGARKAVGCLRVLSRPGHSFPDGRVPALRQAPASGALPRRLPGGPRTCAEGVPSRKDALDAAPLPCGVQLMNFLNSSGSSKP